MLDIHNVKNNNQFDVVEVIGKKLDDKIKAMDQSIKEVDLTIAAIAGVIFMGLLATSAALLCWNPLFVQDWVGGTVLNDVFVLPCFGMGISSIVSAFFGIKTVCPITIYEQEDVVAWDSRGSEFVTLLHCKQTLQEPKFQKLVRMKLTSDSSDSSINSIVQLKKLYQEGRFIQEKYEQDEQAWLEKLSSIS